MPSTLCSVALVCIAVAMLVEFSRTRTKLDALPVGNRGAALGFVPESKFLTSRG
jgi:hypothetical protein